MSTICVAITLSEALFSLPSLYASKSSTLAASAPRIWTHRRKFAGASLGQNVLRACSFSALSPSLELSGAGRIHGWETSRENCRMPCKCDRALAGKLALGAALKLANCTIGGGRLILVCTNTQALTANCGKSGNQPWLCAPPPPPPVTVTTAVWKPYILQHLPRSSETIRPDAKVHLVPNRAIRFSNSGMQRRGVRGRLCWERVGTQRLTFPDPWEVLACWSTKIGELQIQPECLSQKNKSSIARLRDLTSASGFHTHLYTHAHA